VPSTAPVRPRAPAVTAVSARRFQLLAPVAVRVRSSLAVSLRMRPTVMARMPSARTMPKTVAQLMISDDDGMLDLVSTVMPFAAAATRALVICPAVGGFGLWMSQPSGTVCRPRARMACSVITVLGADVPDGRALTSWITGLARQSPFGHGYENVPRPGPTGLLGL